MVLAAAMAAKWWEPPRDALDTMVLGCASLRELTGYSHVDYTPFDPVLKVCLLYPCQSLRDALIMAKVCGYDNCQDLAHLSM